ncbi:MAG: hybrid sensor histidine kinase/response regulator, partial [Cystobacter sp.]
MKPQPPVEAEVAERTLVEMAQHITSSEGPTEALRAQLQLIHGLFQAKACYVARYLPSRNQLHVEHVRGRYDERITAASPEEGIIGRAFAERAILRDEETVAVPLESPLGTSGVLAILAPRRSASDSLLMALAGQLSASYEVARLRDDSARRNKDLQTAIAGLKALEQSRDELLGNVSHDLKNPLTTIKAYLAMMGREKLGSLSDAQRRAVQVCDRSADRMLRMVNDLLLMSRLQAGKMQLNQRPFGLKAVAEEVLRALAPTAEQAKVQLTLPPTGEVFVRGDRERIAEAIQNLVESGINRCEPEDSVELRVGSEDGLALLTVKDSGPGLGTEDLEHVFDPFHRPDGARGQGHSLGLPLVAKIMALHGGRVEATSTLGEGTALQLVMPLFAGAVSTPDLAQAGPRAGGILLVEDDVDCREVLQQVLEQEGYRVMSTSGASEARSILSHIRPAMVLLDLRLSEEDGRSVLRFIRGTESLADVAVYIISGASDVST